MKSRISSEITLTGEINFRMGFNIVIFKTQFKKKSNMFNPIKIFLHFKHDLERKNHAMNMQNILVKRSKYKNSRIYSKSFMHPSL